MNVVPAVELWRFLTSKIIGKLTENDGRRSVVKGERTPARWAWLTFVLVSLVLLGATNEHTGGCLFPMTLILLFIYKKKCVVPLHGRNGLHVKGQITCCSVHTLSRLH